jgi:TrmH family RNA methyltransferase
MTQTITSAHNTRLKELRKLADRKHRERSGLFAAEGEDMLAEATLRGAQPEVVFYDVDERARAEPLLADLPGSVEVVPVEHAALDSASALGSGSRLIGVWRQRWTQPAEHSGAEVALYLHELADPGNVGTILRSTHAFGPGVVILGPRAADPFGPKAVRASMGAVFGQPVARAAFGEAVEALGPDWRSVALVPRTGRSLRDLELVPPTLIVLGAERLGLPDRITLACDEIAQIELRGGGAESLNVAMAATICLYESALHRLPRTQQTADD